MSERVSITPTGSHNLRFNEADKLVTRKITDPEVATRVYQQYLGTLTLLGHALGRGQRPDGMQQDRAFTDANNVLKALGSDVRYRPCSNGGWAAFQETPDAPASSRPRKTS